MFKFRRMRAMNPLQVAMTGVHMGERYLQIFCSDVTLTRGLATTVGLSGSAALAAPDQADARRAETAAAKVGALIEVKVGPATNLEWPDDSFDMVVVDDTGGALSSLPAAEVAACLVAAHRVLRSGGRIELIESTGGGLFAKPSPPEHGAEALRDAGFKPVRTLTEQDGFRFVEGLKS